jgi:hypothetical protein
LFYRVPKKTPTRFKKFAWSHCCSIFRLTQRARVMQLTCPYCRESVVGDQVNFLFETCGSFSGHFVDLLYFFILKIWLKSFIQEETIDFWRLYNTLAPLNYLSWWVQCLLLLIQWCLQIFTNRYSLFNSLKVVTHEFSEMQKYPFNPI